MIAHDLKVARNRWISEAISDEDRKSREASDYLCYRNTIGETVDFHALRHTFITNVVNSGVAPKLAQELARHSTITLTMDRYAHVHIRDTAEAIAKVKLPSSSQLALPLALTPGNDRESMTVHEEPSISETDIPNEEKPLKYSVLSVDEDDREEVSQIRLEGFEPPTLGSEDRCSIQLSYRRKSLPSFLRNCPPHFQEQFRTVDANAQPRAERSIC